MLNRRRFVGLAAAAIAAPSIGPSRAAGADWPAKAVRVVVPFTPGGSTDTTARLVGNRLQEVWGQSVVIENKPGAGGNIASDMVAHSAEGEVPAPSGRSNLIWASDMQETGQLATVCLQVNCETKQSSRTHRESQESTQLY